MRWTSTGQLPYIDYSPRYTRLKRDTFVQPYREWIIVWGEREKGERDGTAEPATGSEDEQHTLCSAQRKKVLVVNYSITTMLSLIWSILFKTGLSATALIDSASTLQSGSRLLWLLGLFDPQTQIVDMILPVGCRCGARSTANLRSHSAKRFYQNDQGKWVRCMT